MDGDVAAPHSGEQLPPPQPEADTVVDGGGDDEAAASSTASTSTPAVANQDSDDDNDDSNDDAAAAANNNSNNNLNCRTILSTASTWYDKAKEYVPAIAQPTLANIEATVGKKLEQYPQTTQRVESFLDDRVLPAAEAAAAKVSE